MPDPQNAYPDLRRSVCVVMSSKQTTWATPQFRRAVLAWPPKYACQALSRAFCTASRDPKAITVGLLRTSARAGELLSMTSISSIGKPSSGTRKTPEALASVRWSIPVACHSRAATKRALVPVVVGVFAGRSR